MKYKNILIRSKVTEALSRKRRAYEPFSPLRDSRILDGKTLYILMPKFKQDRYSSSQSISNYPQLVFKTFERAQQFLDDNQIEDHLPVTIYDQIRAY
jgi:hypothetical protein